MVKKINDIKQILSKYKQEHLLNFYEELSDEEKEDLINEIETIDFNKMQTLYENSKNNEVLDNRFSPINYVIKKELGKEEINTYNQIGEEAIKNNELAILTMAGGQGSRLGIKGPKGSFEINTAKGKKNLFEIIYDNIKKVDEKYNKEPFWLIMTSEDNDEQTKIFFESKNHFNYNKDKIIFFKQDKNPILNIEGKLVLESKGKIKQASNGNGDVFEAIKRNDLIKLLKENGIKYISFGGIDNILAKPIDEMFLGLMIKNNYPIASKTILKENPLEKTAVFCRIDNKPSILGYDYITEEMSNFKDKDGKYLYRDENILAHLMTIEAVEKITELELRYHRAFRKNTFLDVDSKKEKIITENAFKFEKFIFDAFSYFNDMLLLRVEKENEFAPIKSFEGNNNVEKAIELYNKNFI